MSSITHTSGKNPSVDLEDNTRPSLGFHRLLDRLERIFGVVFILVVALNFASAAGRYLVGKPIMGADEVQVYTMVWLIFLGSAVTAMRRAHLRMDVLTMNLGTKAAWWRNLAEALLVIAVCGLMVWVSTGFTLQIYGMEQKSDAAEIPMWIPHASVLAGFIGMGLCAALEVNGLLRRRPKSSRATSS